MAENVSVTIDGREVEVPAGTLIIEAARKAGVEIPTFCYDERLRSVGACRMCLVEVEKMPKLIASCATPVAPNMIVHTESEKVVKARKGVLEFLLINHPLDCPTCDKGGECPLQDNTYLYGPPVSRYKEDKIRFIDEKNGSKFDDIPLGREILLCRNRCIMCYKCVRIVRDLAGEADLGVFQRGAFANIGVLDEVAFADEFSGNTVEYCPVGALTSRSFRYKVRDWLLKKAPGVCNLCSDGCNMYVEWSGEKVHRHMARRNPDIDDGWLCDRGRYGFDITRAADRLTQPRIRRGNALEPCGWEEADALVAKHLSMLLDENRASEIGVVGSPMLSNEEAYSIRQFFGEIIKAANIDFQTEYAEPLDGELLDLIGLDGRIAELDYDDLFVFIGMDPAVEHPVTTLRIKKAVGRKTAKAIFIGSYDKRLGYFPVENIRTPHAAEPSAIDRVISALSGEKTLPDSAALPDQDTLNRLAETIRKSKRIHIMAGRGFLIHPERKRLLSAMMKLKSKTGARLSILPPQGNFMGVSRFGLFGGPEHSFPDLLARVNSGDIKTMFIFGANPIEEFPDRKYVNDTLKKLDFLVVVNPFVTSTAALASIVYPQALPGDYGGSFVNIENRVQRFEAMDDRIRWRYRPVWSILGEIASTMEIGIYWKHHTQVRDHMAENLKGMEGLKNVLDTGLIIDRTPAKEYSSTDIGPSPPPSGKSSGEFVLQWTPTVHHPSWLTEKSENLMRIAGDQVAIMNPDDSARLDITQGNFVRIGTEETAINLRVMVSDKVNKGEILIENSFSENAVNRLMKKENKMTFVSARKI